MATSDWRAASNCEQLDMFSIPFLRGELTELDLETVRQDCRNLVAKAKQKHGDLKSNNYTSYFDEDLRQELILLPWYKDFSEQVKDTYIQFINTCYGQEVSYLNRSDLHLFAWVNVYNSEHFHPSHNHINAYMSGTWYVKCDDEDNQPIQFENPNRALAYGLNLPVSEWGKPEVADAKFIGSANYHDLVEFYPRDNQFLLWPSAVMHSVPPLHRVNPDYERISISFNLHHPIEVPNQNESGDDLEYSFFGQSNPPVEEPIEEPIEELPSAVDDAAEVMQETMIPRRPLF